MASPSSTSIQLPDLPTLTRSFELRANKACRSVTLTSEARFLKPKPISGSEPDITLSNSERAIVPTAKIGLLCGLCFPTCDPPQLRFLTDFMTVLTFAHQRLVLARNFAQSGWWLSQTGAVECNVPQESTNRGIEILNEHELFKGLTPELTLFCSRASLTWHARFSRSSLTYQRAQLDSLKPPPTPFLGNDDPNVLESYVSLRRDMSGADMIFDLIEVALGHRPLEDTDIDSHSPDLCAARTILVHALDTLRDLAAEIVALSLDIVSYSQFHSTRIRPPPDHLPHNTVMVCMLSRNLSSQGAINAVVNILKNKIRSFLDLDNCLQSLAHSCRPRPSMENSTYSWIVTSIKSIVIRANNSDQDKTPLIKSLSLLQPSVGLSKLVRSLDAYIHILRDYISGNVHWFYETELYFGTKGEEVKAFGWVFLNPPQVSGIS
ncbi:hypothetical protein F5887DRAFT_679723 [Amanita rubescens]|nr:hypothetical protein F5887DRAFT_679723 [Amanita rubescens]